MDGLRIQVEFLQHLIVLVVLGIAGKSPLAIIGTKRVLIQGRDLTVDQGLDYVATWNSATLVSDDLIETKEAQVQKRKPAYSKL